MANDPLSQQYLSLNKGGNLTSEQVNLAFQDRYGMDAPGNVMSDFAGKVGGQDTHFLARVQRGDFDKELQQKNPDYLRQSQAALQQRQYLKAIEPAMQSYEQQLPEIAQKFASTREQIGAEVDPLKQRYDNLIADIKGAGQRAEDRQQLVTSREMSRRGIQGGSLREQEIASALEPISMQIGSQVKDIGFERESGLRNLQNLIANLTSQETEAQRAVRNAMAQLQAQTSIGGLQQGQQNYQFDVNNALAQAQARLNEEMQRAQLAEMQQPKTPELKYANVLGGGYLYNPYTGDISRTLSDLRGTSNNANTSSNDPLGILGSK